MGRIVVPGTGVEPVRLAAQDFKSRVSAISPPGRRHNIAWQGEKIKVGCAKSPDTHPPCLFILQSAERGGGSGLSSRFIASACTLPKAGVRGLAPASCAEAEPKREGGGGNFPRVRQAAFMVFCVASPQKRGDRTKKRKRILEPIHTHAGRAHTPEPWCRAFALPRGFARGGEEPHLQKSARSTTDNCRLPKAPGGHRRRRRTSSTNSRSSPAEQT